MFVPSPDTTGFGALLRATGATHRFEAARFPCRTMSNEDEHVQGLAGERRDGEEVGGPQVGERGCARTSAIRHDFAVQVSLPDRVCPGRGRVRLPRPPLGTRPKSMKCLEISVAAFLGQSVKEVRPPATCAEKRLVGRTSRKAAETSIRKLCACRLPRASLSQKFGRLRLVPKSGLSAELLGPRPKTIVLVTFGGRVPRPVCHKKFGRLRLGPKSGLSAKLLVALGSAVRATAEAVACGIRWIPVRQPVRLRVRQGQPRPRLGRQPLLAPPRPRPSAAARSRAPLLADPSP